MGGIWSVWAVESGMTQTQDLNIPPAVLAEAAVAMSEAARRHPNSTWDALINDAAPVIVEWVRRYEWARATNAEVVQLLTERRLEEVEAERDALRAQLDAMTTETRIRRLAVDERGKIIGGQLIHGQRLVGPWMEVTD